ncbi:hypothetical protein HMPREF1992_01716 [Selenomonas sp. oral taxon 892 str. F0426]|nr:hypothetical protein HMPREF1992_01716 [Selenomonas sp. oral taxon 892 str. F0426]
MCYTLLCRYGMFFAHYITFPHGTQVHWSQRAVILLGKGIKIKYGVMKNIDSVYFEGTVVK